jgi:hypothetical protein
MNPQGELSFFFPREGWGGNEEGSKINFYGQRLALHCKNIKEKKTVARRPNKKLRHEIYGFSVV